MSHGSAGAVAAAFKAAAAGATSLRGVFGNAASASGSVASASLSGLGIQAGDVAYVAISLNAASPTITTPPSGWTLEAGPVNQNNVNQTYLYKKTLTGSETTVSATWSASGRWTIAGAVVAGGLLGPDSDTAVVGASSTTLALPSYTPAVGSCYAIALVSAHNAAGAFSLTATPAGWSKLGEFQTSFGSGAQREVLVLGRQLGAGTGGVSQSGGSGTWSSTSVQVGWVLTVAPA